MARPTTTFPTLDPDLCTGCRRCESACVEIRYPDLLGPPGPAGPATLDPDHPAVLERRRLAVRFSLDPADPAAPRASRPSGLSVCTHCADHPCTPVCPHHALIRWPGGAVELREDRCTGCGRCVSACPVRGIRRAVDLSLAMKCDGCAPLGIAPACAAACPSGALTLLPLPTPAPPLPVPGPPLMKPPSEG